MTPAVFIDRDGTLVEQKDGSYISSIKEVRFKNQYLYSLLGKLQKDGYLLIIVTNQAGINKGLVSWVQVNRINSYIIRELRKKGVRITDVYVCPHRIEEGCNCRKPQPGLLLQASKEYKVNLESSIIIGDRDMDLEAAVRAGLRMAIRV